MASTQVLDSNRLVKTVLASIATGDPQVIGQIPGVATIATDGSGNVTLQREGVFKMLVGGINGSGSIAVNNGDILYFTSGDTPKVNKKTTGVRFGYAYDATVAPGTELVASGATTTTIPVMLGY